MSTENPNFFLNLAAQNYPGVYSIARDKGEKIYHQGEPDYQVMLLASGLAQTVRKHPDNGVIATGLYSDNMLLNNPLEQEIFPFSDTCTAITPCEIIGIDRTKLPLFQQTPEYNRQLNILLLKERAMLRKLILINGNAVLTEKFAHIMYWLTKDGQEPSPAFRQSDLAAFVGVNRPTASRALNSLVDQGVLVNSNGNKMLSYRFTEQGRVKYSR